MVFFGYFFAVYTLLGSVDNLWGIATEPLLGGL